MDFTIIGEVTDVEIIARGSGIRRLKTLMKRYGGKKWRKMKGLATVRTWNGSTRGAKCIGTRPTAPDARDGRSSVSSTDGEEMMIEKAASHSKFVLFIHSGASEDLEVRKVYEARPDRKAASEGYLRIIDESGEDYLYPSEFFVPVKLPAATMRAFGEQAVAS